MEILKTSSGEQLNDLTLFAGATLANLLVPQANDTEPTTHDTYGHGLEQPLANYDPTMQFWKTSQDISLWGEPQLLATLPKSGMTRNGALYLQPDWVPPINETDLLSWPTPTVANWVTSTTVEATRQQMINGQKYSSRIVQAVALAEPTAIGHLNPTWVEWLMGFPTGWTNLKD